MKRHWKILVVDDEEVMCESLAAWLREDGFAVDVAFSGREALDKSAQNEYAIYFIDLKMPGGMDGIETLMHIRRKQPEASIIIITAYATVDTAIAAMKEGAQEYIVKPCNPEEISLLVSRIIKVKNLQRENLILRKKLSRHYEFQDIISKNAKMQDMLRLAGEVASLRSTVLIRGESGTGKELVARAIHYSGDRAAKPFIAVSCAALTETLLESELFGYEKGAFTGAVKTTLGKIETASGGTLFLDEIGDMPLALQAKLLRFLQDRTIERVGGRQEIAVDVRIVCATNRDLQAFIVEQKFRQDLYFRIGEVTINVPPLRERAGGATVLAHAMLRKFGNVGGKSKRGFTEEATAALEAYSWPGNVRELENRVKTAMIMAETNLISANDLGLKESTESALLFNLKEVRTRAERQAIRQAMSITDGNVSRAAELLGVTRPTLYDLMEKYGIRETS